MDTKDGTVALAVKHAAIVQRKTVLPLIVAILASAAPAHPIQAQIHPDPNYEPPGNRVSEAMERKRAELLSKRLGNYSKDEKWSIYTPAVEWYFGNTLDKSRDIDSQLNQICASDSARRRQIIDNYRCVLTNNAPYKPTLSPKDTEELRAAINESLHNPPQTTFGWLKLSCRELTLYTNTDPRSTDPLLAARRQLLEDKLKEQAIAAVMGIPERNFDPYNNRDDAELLRSVGGLRQDMKAARVAERQRVEGEASAINNR